MKPYYEDSEVTIYHGDCREILPDIHVDIILTDPPYGVGIEYGVASDSPEYHADRVTEWFSIMKASCDVLGISCGVPNIWLWPPSTWILCWHKPFSVSHSPVGANNWEPLLIYFDKGRRCDRQSDYFAATFISEENDHPCPKPLKWALGALSIISKNGEDICDPFMGSGTTLRAAKDLGRKAIGIEIEEKYCEIAARRMEQEVLPLNFASNPQTEVADTALLFT